MIEHETPTEIGQPELETDQTAHEDSEQLPFVSRWSQRVARVGAIAVATICVASPITTEHTALKFGDEEVNGMHMDLPGCEPFDSDRGISNFQEAKNEEQVKRAGAVKSAAEKVESDGINPVRIIKSNYELTEYKQDEFKARGITFIFKSDEPEAYKVNKEAFTEGFFAVIDNPDLQEHSHVKSNIACLQERLKSGEFDGTEVNIVIPSSPNKCWINGSLVEPKPATATKEKEECNAIGSTPPGFRTPTGYKYYLSLAPNRLDHSKGEKSMAKWLPHEATHQFTNFTHPVAHIRTHEQFVKTATDDALQKLHPDGNIPIPIEYIEEEKPTIHKTR